MLVSPGAKKVKTATARLKTASAVKTFPAPTRGWVTNENIAAAQPGGAFVLDNFWVESKSIKPRAGSAIHGTVHASDPCETLMAYVSGTAEKLFAATATDIYDVSNPVDPLVIPTAAMTGITNGDFSWTNFATAADNGFIVGVNGTDRAIYYDGATWRFIDDATTELPFDAQTVNFGAGPLTVTGGTSGATGVIVEVIDNGTTGTLRLKSVSGPFQDNELITASTGSATANIPSGATTVPAITGLSTTLFSAVWIYKSRMFFLRKDSLTAYYNPTVDSIGGAPGAISLAGVMQRGGSLMIGATWSTDAGDGMDDMCVFVSDQGEVAVYQGSDPSDATAWNLVGVYQMPAPLHKNAIMKAGGNLLVATEQGLIPISSAIRKDIAAVALDSVSLPIEPTWQDYIADRPGKWVVAKWAAKNRGIIGIPDGDETDHAFGMNLQTGAWCRIVGWNINCAVELGGDLYFGTSDGKVMKADSTGADNGSAYYCLYVGLHESINATTAEKVAHMVKTTWRAATDFSYKISFGFNYNYTELSYPSAPVEADTALWDAALWDVSTWPSSQKRIASTQWRSTNGHGFAAAPVLQMAMGTATAPNIEFISADLLYETGTIVSS